jgi:hypothetical protein
MRHIRLGPTVAGLVIVVTACSDSAGPSAETPSNATTPSVLITSSTPSQPPGAVGGPLLVLDEPPVAVPVPEGYRNDSMEEYRAALEAAMEQYPENEQHLIQDLIDEVDTGRFVGSFTASSGSPAPNIAILVDLVDETVAAAADRLTLELQDTGSRQNVWTVVERERLELRLGPAIRVVAKQDPAPGIVSRAVIYVLRVDSSTTLTIQGTAPFSDETFAGVVDRLALAVRSSL